MHEGSREPLDVYKILEAHLNDSRELAPAQAYITFDLAPDDMGPVPFGANNCRGVLLGLEEKDDDSDTLAVVGNIDKSLTGDVEGLLSVPIRRMSEIVTTVINLPEN